MENKPSQKFKAGNVSATIWENKAKKDNKEYTFFNVTIERNFKDGEDWKKTSSFMKNDLPKVELVTRKAFEFLALSEQEE